ncbi:MAG: segregation/condensation protein A [Proteobacteria bacterium]|nr:segregation/condensation protein A [Pseudomonadota bacterium]
MSISVKLEQFEGPLDLLLHLIKKEKIDIYDIPISEITAQYLEYIENMKKLNIYVASEFLVMAATLIYIKSKMLLPKKVTINEEIQNDDIIAEDDPRLPLVQRLLEYQKIKDLVEILEKKDCLYRDFFPRGYTEFTIDFAEKEFDSYELVKIFYSLIEKMPDSLSLEVELEKITIRDMINNILETLRERKKITFIEYASQLKSKIELIVFFLALLELAKIRMITLMQSALFQDIDISLRIEQA